MKILYYFLLTCFYTSIYGLYFPVNEVRSIDSDENWQEIRRYEKGAEDIQEDHPLAHSTQQENTNSGKKQRIIITSDSDTESDTDWQELDIDIVIGEKTPNKGKIKKKKKNKELKDMEAALLLKKFNAPALRDDRSYTPTFILPDQLPDLPLFQFEDNEDNADTSELLFIKNPIQSEVLPREESSDEKRLLIASNYSNSTSSNEDTLSQDLQALENSLQGAQKRLFIELKSYIDMYHAGRISQEALFESQVDLLRRVASGEFTDTQQMLEHQERCQQLVSQIDAIEDEEVYNSVVAQDNLDDSASLLDALEQEQLARRSNQGPLLMQIEAGSSAHHENVEQLDDLLSQLEIEEIADEEENLEVSPRIPLASDIVSIRQVSTQPVQAGANLSVQRAASVVPSNYYIDTVQRATTQSRQRTPSAGAPRYNDGDCSCPWWKPVIFTSICAAAGVGIGLGIWDAYVHRPWGPNPRIK